MSLELQGGFLTTGPFQGNPLMTLSLTFQSSGSVKGNTGPGVRKLAVRQIMNTLTASVSLSVKWGNFSPKAA